MINPTFFIDGIIYRILFYFMVGFHVVFPIFNIGLVLFLVVVRGCWLKTRNKRYLAIFEFWNRIFSRTVAIGSVTGIVLSYMLGAGFGPFTRLPIKELRRLKFIKINPSLLISRFLFDFTVGFHVVFPVLNIGLALFLVFVGGCWLKTGNKRYLDIFKFWGRTFALTFGVGAVTGLVLSYELGANFGPFTRLPIKEIRRLKVLRRLRFL